jgi:hypothetical protein
MCKKKTNLIVANNKSKCFKQHQFLLFLHRAPNMAFLTTTLLLVRKNSHVRCKNNSEFFDFVCYFYKKNIGARAYEIRLKNAFFYFFIVNYTTTDLVNKGGNLFINKT